MDITGTGVGAVDYRALGYGSIEAVMDEQINSRPAQATSLLTKEHGIWVFRAEEPISASAVDEVIRDIREDRDINNLSKATFKL